MGKNPSFSPVDLVLGFVLLMSIELFHFLVFPRYRKEMFFFPFAPIVIG